VKRRRVIAVIAAGLAAGIACGLVADRHIATVAVLLLEPILWLATAGAAAILAYRRGVTVAVVAAAMVAAFSAGVRLAVLDVTAPAPDERFAAFGRCAQGAPPEQVRIATWNVLALNEDDAVVEAASAIDADVLVLHEVIREELGQRIARAWNGEAVHEKAIADWGTTIVVRDGRFVPCEGRTNEVVELAAQARRRAIGIAAAIEVRGGTFPIVTLHTDRPTSFSEAARWPDAMHVSARRVAAAVRAIDHPAVVVTGDTNTHATFHRFHRTIESAGVTGAPAPRTWPAQLGRVPFLPLYTLDRLWAGPTWDIAGLETERLEVPSDHLAIIVDLRS
jgi:endonuclease/exonuclease/phosphatase family metal-dependent hydrolase